MKKKNGRIDSSYKNEPAKTPSKQSRCKTGTQKVYFDGSSKGSHRSLLRTTVVDNMVTIVIGNKRTFQFKEKQLLCWTTQKTIILVGLYFVLQLQVFAARRCQILRSFAYTIFQTVKDARVEQFKIQYFSLKTVLFKVKPFKV